MSEISFININAIELRLNDKEICRYLNMRACDGALCGLIDGCKKDVAGVASPKAVFAKVSVKALNEKLSLGFGDVCSKKLAKNLCGCGEAFVFCATLGQEVDRLINKYSKIEPSKAIVLDSVATAMIEEFCDCVNDILGENRSLRPRFSCGYGDFDIKHQAEILDFLDAKKRIGVYLLDSYMMTPFKTVTAIVGIAK